MEAAAGAPDADSLRSILLVVRKETERVMKNKNLPNLRRGLFRFSPDLTEKVCEVCEVCEEKM